MKRKLCLWIAAAFVVSCAALYADDDSHKQEGKIVQIDPSSKVMVVQTEKGDQSTLYWTETTKLEDGLTFKELRPGDTVEYHFVDKDGQKYVTTIEREHKGDRH
jgi:Cu/Ag efflux protein CusF